VAGKSAAEGEGKILVIFERRIGKKYWLQIDAGITEWKINVLPSLQIWTYDCGPIISFLWLSFYINFDFDNHSDQ